MTVIEWVKQNLGSQNNQESSYKYNTHKHHPTQVDQKTSFGPYDMNQETSIIQYASMKI